MYIVLSVALCSILPCILVGTRLLSVNSAFWTFPPQCSRGGNQLVFCCLIDTKGRRLGRTICCKILTCYLLTFWKCVQPKGFKNAKIVPLSLPQGRSTRVEKRKITQIRSKQPPYMKKEKLIIHYRLGYKCYPQEIVIKNSWVFPWSLETITILICAAESGAHHCLGKRHERVEGAFLCNVLLDIHGSRKET